MKKLFIVSILLSFLFLPAVHAGIFEQDDLFLLAKATKLGRTGAAGMQNASSIQTNFSSSAEIPEKQAQLDCDLNCRSCNTTTGACLECNEGRYLSDNLCLSCPENCTKCLNSNTCTSCNTGYGMNNGKCTPGTNYYNANKSACFLVTDDYVGWCGGNDHAGAWECISLGNVASWESFVNEDPTGSVIKVALSDCTSNGGKHLPAGCGTGRAFDNGQCVTGTNYYTALENACYLVTDDYVGWCGGNDHTGAGECITLGNVGTWSEFVNADPTGAVKKVLLSDCNYGSLSTK